MRDKLQSLGDFAHLIVYRQGDHLFIAQPAGSPDDIDPLLRITHGGRWRSDCPYDAPAAVGNSLPLPERRSSSTLDYGNGGSLRLPAIRLYT